MRNTIIAACVLVAVLLSYRLGYNDGHRHITQTREHDEYRHTQNDLADMRARIETLEEMAIDINVIDHTGIYSVFGVQVK